MTRLAIWRIVRDSVHDLGTHHALKLAAALAYYAALSLSPLLIIVLAIAGLVLERSVAAEAIAVEMERVLGSGAGDLLRGFTADPGVGGKGVLATVFGVVALAFGATGFFVELQDDLDLLWGVPKRKRAGILSFLHHRLLSLAMVVSLGFLLLVSFVVDSGLSVLARPIEAVTGAHTVVAAVVHFLVSLVVDAVFFALIFKLLPEARVRWRDALRGAAVTGVLFVLGQAAIAQYLGRAAVGSAWGAAGSLVLVLVWVYYSAVIALFGAVITWRLSKSKDRTPPAEVPRSTFAASRTGS